MRKDHYIDATKYEIRALWTGIGEEHTAEAAGLVEGYPFEPPDELPGWQLVDYQIGKDGGYRFFTLWVKERLKVVTKKRGRTKKPTNGVLLDDPRPEPLPFYEGK